MAGIRVLTNLAIAVLVTASMPLSTWGDDKDPKQADSVSKLVLEQEKIADAFDRFKQNLIDLAAVMRETNPSRASLLEKAVERMNEDATDERFGEILAALRQDSLLLRDV
ncbi:MAG: hypothetical protein VX257_06645, partial [Planctomycetota bacterium]|nr:hypothetical protein [Planctomycetota bacterium]